MPMSSWRACAPTSSVASGSTPRQARSRFGVRDPLAPERPNLRPRTVELYEGELRLHILPVLGDLELAQLSSGRVRTWHATMLTGDRPGKSTVAKCYRLLSSIMATALEDDLIGRNPCVLKNAGVERPRERPIATVEEVFALAEAIEPRYRTLVLTATFTGLRPGELRALKRRRRDLLHRTVQVVEQLQELSDRTLVIGPQRATPEAGPCRFRRRCCPS